MMRGEEDALSAEMGKQLGIAVKTTLQIGSGVTYVELIGEDIGGTFVAPKIRSASNFGNTSSAGNPRATTQGIIDNTSGTLPDTIELYIPVGKGFTGAITWCTVNNGVGDRAFTDWLAEGWNTIDCTQYNKTSGNVARPYLAITIAKSSAFSDDDLAVINGANGPKIRYSQAIEITGGNKALSIVDEDGDEVLGINCPSMPEASPFEIYSKAAVDTLIENVRPNPFNADLVRRVLRVCHWNIGRFGLGGDTANSTLDNEGLQVKKWKNKIAQFSPDILLMCEFRDSASAIFENFPYQDIDRGANQTNYNWLAMMSNYPIASKSRVQDWDYTNLGTKAYHLFDTINIGNQTITIVEVHLNLNASSRQTQITQILGEVSNLDRVILAGDFNNVDPSEYDAFKTAGFELFNCDVYDRVNTYPATGLTDSNYTSGLPSIAIDNIMVKGLKIVGAQVIDDGTLTDHCGVVCDLVLI